jgi:hypothetical protein
MALFAQSRNDDAQSARDALRGRSRQQNTEFAGLLHKKAPFGPLSDLMLQGHNRGTKK